MEDRALGTLLLTGYGNLPPAVFFGSLADWGADLAVDIRLNPWGWRPEYSRGRFLDGLRTAGIPDATHRADLGNRAYKTGGMDVPQSGVEWLSERLAEGLTVAIICACRTSADCHRRHIADRLVQRFPSLSIVEF